MWESLAAVKSAPVLNQFLVTKRKNKKRRRRPVES